MTTIDPLYSRCSLGCNRWFWCVWADFDALCDGTPLPVTGFAPTAAEAEQAALKIAPQAERMQVSFAAGYHRRLCAKERAARPAKGEQETATLEFVYQDWMSDYDDQWHSTPHLIVKKTPKKVFVERDGYNPDHKPYGDWRDYYYRETYALDRAKLERDGNASTGRGWWQSFHTKPWEERHATTPAPTCLAVLGLDADATEAKIKSAYRRLVKQHHPDRGGDAERFKEVQAAFEDALSLATQRGDRREGRCQCA